MPRPDSAAARAAFAILHRLRAHGHAAYVAGGAPRDLLLGQTPVDFDIATSARPEQVMLLFSKTIAVGARFGVVRVLHPGGEVEVATFRTDGTYRDGRHPSSVAFAGVAEDVARRDFTINGLLYDPEAQQVIDYVGGIADLNARVIRCIGAPEARFREDHLRMLRAVRFAARFDFALQPETEAALRRLAPAIEQVSAERVRDELLKMLLGPRPGAALRTLAAVDLLPWILPEVAALQAQPPDVHPEGDLFEHTVRTVSALEFPADRPRWTLEALALAALLHDVGKPETQQMDDGRIHFRSHAARGAHLAEQVARRLRLSRRQVERVRALVADHDRIRHALEMRRARLLRLLREPHAADLLALHRADRLGASGDLTAYRFASEVLASLPAETMRPPRLLTGHDLIGRGLRPGPELGRILRALEDAQLEGRVRTRAEAEAWLEAYLAGEEPPQ